MRWIAGLNIIGKMIVPSVVLALVFAVVCWQALSSLAKVETLAITTLDEDVVQLLDGQQAAYDFTRMTTDIRNVVMAASAAERGAAETACRNHLGLVRKEIDDYIRSEDDQSHVAKARRVLTLVDTFESLSGKAFALAGDGHRDQAWAMINGEATKAYDDATALLTEVNKENLAAVAAKKTEMAATGSFARHSALTIAVLGSLLGFGLLAAVARWQIARPVGEVTAALKALAAGDLTVAVSGTERRDEVGLLSQALGSLKDQMIQADRMKAEQVAMQAARETRAQVLETLTSDFDRAVSAVLETVSGAATEMTRTSQSMSATAEQTNRQATSVAVASADASASVQTVASAAEELAESIGEIGRQVEQSSRITKSASAEASRTNLTVRGLAESSAKIGEVVSLITDIAGQTNLLALNATKFRSIKQRQFA